MLVLETLLWPDEIRPAEFPFLEQDIEVRPQELTMAASLIDSMTADFDSDAFHDNYREALIELVEAKVEGRELLQPGTLEIASSPAASLTDALKASLEAHRAGQGEQKALSSGRDSASDDDHGGSGGSGSGTGAAKASPAKASPAKASPAKASPAKGGTRKASADKPSTGKTSSARTTSKSRTTKPAN